MKLSIVVGLSAAFRACSVEPVETIQARNPLNQFGDLNSLAVY